MQEWCNKIDQIYFVTALLQSFLQEKGDFSSNFEHKKECLYCELSSGEKKSVMQSLILVSCFCRSGDIRPTKYKNWLLFIRMYSRHLFGSFLISWKIYEKHQIPLFLLDMAGPNIAFQFDLLHFLRRPPKAERLTQQQLLFEPLFWFFHLCNFPAYFISSTPSLFLLFLIILPVQSPFKFFRTFFSFEISEMIAQFLLDGYTVYKFQARATQQLHCRIVGKTLV